MFLHPILPGVGKWLAEFTATSQVKHSSQRIRSSDDVDIATRNRPEADGLYSSEAFAQRAVTVVNAHASEENGQPQQPLFLFMPFTAPHTPTQVCTQSIFCDRRQQWTVPVELMKIS
jgi:hypothetical protein